MLVTNIIMLIVPAKVAASYAPRYTVIVRCVLKTDEGLSALCHFVPSSKVILLEQTLPSEVLLCDLNKGAVFMIAHQSQWDSLAYKSLQRHPL